MSMIPAAFILAGVLLSGTKVECSLPGLDSLIAQANIYYQPPLQAAESERTMADVSALDSLKDLKVIVHGFTAARAHISIKPLVDAYLNVGHGNVFVCDWEGAASLDYHTSRGAVNKVAVQLARVLDAFLKRLNIDRRQVHVIGHSLGAHIAGDIGRYFNGSLGRVTGLDPALPLFTPHASDGLRATAAHFVDVIHTDYPVFGDLTPRGTVDFYPNFGRAPQRGCEEIDFFTATRLILEAYSCSHNHAVILFAETVEDPQRYPTISCRWNGIRTRSVGACFKKKGLLESSGGAYGEGVTFVEALDGLDPTAIVYMGESVVKSAKGFYYLD